ncbi:MAG: hypothetical protein JW723_12725 [Bacteroidales bacterium]|nr:hypothetical protein [Bacteroidales bacterium]
MRRNLTACIFVLFLLPAFSQVDSVNLVRYTPDFRFKEGIFANYEQVKRNQPIPKSRILTDVSYDDPYFFDRIVEKKKLYYYDIYGVKQEIRIADIWGYSRNGVLYIGMNEGFYRITIIGSICHFVANLTTYNTGYPYYPYYDYYDYYSPYNIRQTPRTTNEMRQYIMDFGTGKVMEYDVSSVEVLLMKDPELHDEFVSLRRKKKKQLKFLYIRKFNERNPLYISNK